jgi:hypothetical protein
MKTALRRLAKAAGTRKSGRTSLAALAVAEAGLDLQLRYRPQADVDLARFGVWARRLGVDAAATDRSAVRGDVASLEWVRDRLTLARPAGAAIDDQLRFLRAAAEAGQLRAAAVVVDRLRRTADGLERQP